MDIKKALLGLLESDCRTTPKQAAVMLGLGEEEVREAVASLEREGVILGYKAVVDWDKTDREMVSALIELKVSPQKNRGFDQIAEMICAFPEVQAVYLVSGGYDIAVMLEERTMREVAYFVSEKLAAMNNIVSTATHFVLKKYKEKNVIYDSSEPDTRSNVV